MKSFFVKLSLVTCLLTVSLSSGVLATTKTNEKTNMNAKDSNVIQTKVIEYNKILEKYNLKPLEESEVKRLKLDKNNLKILSSSVSAKELENYIIEAKSHRDVKLEDKIPSNIQLKSSSIVPYFNTDPITTTITDTFSRSTSPFSGLTITTSAAGTYQYTFVQYPGEPASIYNKHFISCDNGKVTQSASNSMLPYSYLLDSVTSSRCTIYDSTTLQHNYSYVVGIYYGLGIPGTGLVKWFHMGSNTVTGTTYYSI